MRSPRTCGVLLVSVVCCGNVLAQEKDVTQVGVRLGPPNFSGMPGGSGFTCSQVVAPIPDANPAGISNTILIENNPNPVPAVLLLDIEITHTWVGDLRVTLAHGPTRTVIDRPGVPSSPFGCSGDDIDVTLTSGGSPSVEFVCAAAVPTISGIAGSSPDALNFVGPGMVQNGGWTLNVADLAGGDVGTLDAWCISVESGPGGPGGPTGGLTTGGGGDPAGPMTTGGAGTPATDTWGVVLLIAVFLGISAYQLRRPRNV